MCDVLLSFCIPTYNRSAELGELLKLILSIKSDKFNVIITDNCSTDNTLCELKKINDSRLIIYTNKKPLPALCNMIQAVFNCNGKYRFLCNDREMIFPERMINLISFLENIEKDFSFVYAGEDGEKITNKVYIYNTTYESLINHRPTCHPSGMIFNGYIIDKFLKKKTYFSYIENQYVYSFLMRDLFLYGPSAIYDYGCWKQRTATYLQKNKSGSNNTKILYFYPEISFRNCIDIFAQIFSSDKYRLTKNEKEEVALYIGKFFAAKIRGYKGGMWSITQTMHYGIDMKFISWFTMHRITYKFCVEILKLLGKYKFEKKTIVKWVFLTGYLIIRNLGSSILIDFNKIILRKNW